MDNTLSILSSISRAVLGAYARVGTSVDDLQTGRQFRRGLAVGNSHRGGLGLHLLVLERRSDVGDGAAGV